MTVDEELISSIGRGLLVFAGIGHDDTEKEAENLVNKVLKAKFWPDEDGKPVGTHEPKFDCAIRVLIDFTVEEERAGNGGRGPLWYVSPIHARFITLLTLSRI